MNETNIQAEWFRLPIRGGDPRFGITRPTYYKLIREGAIKSACIRKPGSLTGIRLVNTESVRRFVERHVEQPAAGKAG
jgi:hypothetical protein